MRGASATEAVRRAGERPATGGAGPRVVHVMTVPASLYFLSGQISYLRDQGFELHAISSPGEHLELFRAQEGIPVHAVPMTRAISPLRDLMALLRLWWVIRRLEPDIVHAHTPKGGLLGMMAATMAGAPVRIYHMRGLPFATATGWRRHLLLTTERVSCALAHRVYSISRSMMTTAVREGICRPDKIEVLLAGSGNGVDAARRFRPLAAAVRAATLAKHGIQPDALVVGYVGRLARDKGLVELAEAWTKLRERFPRLHLIVVGPADRADPVPPEVLTALRADPRVHLTGAARETPPLYAAMDVLAFPTYREGFGNVALEAAAMEVPVVATRVTGCFDSVADGVTGTLVPARDARALGDALERYLTDPALRSRHGCAGRRRALADFSPLAIWQALADGYRDLLERADRPRPARRGDATVAGPDGSSRT